MHQTHPYIKSLTFHYLCYKSHFYAIKIACQTGPQFQNYLSIFVIVSHYYSFSLNAVNFSFFFPTPFTISICNMRHTIKLIGSRHLDELRQLDSLEPLSSFRNINQQAQELTSLQPIIQSAKQLQRTKSYLVCCFFPFYIFLYFCFLVFLFLFTSNLLNSGNGYQLLKIVITLPICSKFVFLFFVLKQYTAC